MACHLSCAPAISLTIPFAIPRRLHEYPPPFMQSCLKHLPPHPAGTALLLCLTSAALAAPGDWPQFRGPNRDGASTDTGLLKAAAAGRPAAGLEGHGFGRRVTPRCPSSGDRIYTCGENKRLQLASSPERGRRQAGLDRQARQSRRAGHARFRRAAQHADRRRVTCWSPSANGATWSALSTAQGKELWRKDYIKDFGGKRPHLGLCRIPAD